MIENLGVIAHPIAGKVMVMYCKRVAFFRHYQVQEHGTPADESASAKWYALRTTAMEMAFRTIITEAAIQRLRDSGAKIAKACGKEVNDNAQA